MLSLAAESWTWYAFVILVVVFRYVSRYLHLGSLKRLQPEDWLMLFVVAIYTVLISFINIVAFVDTNLMLPEDIPTLTPESIQSRIYGSKLVLVVEQCMITTQWGCKICLLLMYHKLTMGLSRKWAVKIVGGYVALSWLLMEVLYFGIWCRPFDQYWAVPVQNIQCSAAINHLIINATFNISSDIMMLSIPLPLLITSQLPPIKKAALCGLFGLGIFVILCSTLNKYYSFTEPFSPIWTFWYVREASTAILVANIPNCWPLLRRIFHLRSFLGSSDNTITGGGGTAGRNVNISALRNGDILLGNTSAAGLKMSSTDDRIFSHAPHGQSRAKSESTEYINALDESGSESGGGGRTRSKEVPLEIWQDVEVLIHKSDAHGPGPGHGHDHGHVHPDRRPDPHHVRKQWGLGAELHGSGGGGDGGYLSGQTQTVITVGPPPPGS